MLSPEAAALGAAQPSALTVRQNLAMQILVSLAPMPGLVMAKCVEKAIEGADGLLEALVKATPLPAPAPIPVQPIPVVPLALPAVK